MEAASLAPVASLRAPNALLQLRILLPAVLCTQLALTLRDEFLVPGHAALLVLVLSLVVQEALPGQTRVKKMGPEPH